MKVAILEPNLSASIGHYWEDAKILLRELQQRGNTVALHGNRRLGVELLDKAARQGIPIIPTFRNPLNWFWQTNTPDQADYRAAAEATADDLAQLGDYDLLFWPTIEPSALLACTLQPTPTPIVCGVHIAPGLFRPAGPVIWRQATRAIARHARPPIKLGAYHSSVRAALRTYSPELTLHELPSLYQGTGQPRPAGRLQRIGFFGHQRLERGATLVPDLVQMLLKRGFDVTLQDSSLQFKVHGQIDRLTVLHYVEDIAAAMAACDLVIWPSRYAQYTERSSGIVSQCIAEGIPFIAPSGCAPSQEAAELGTGTFFHADSVAAIAEALDEAVADFPALLARASHAAAQWRLAHGPDRLAQWLEAHGRDGTPQPASAY